MRIYKNCKEAVVDIGRELQKCSTEIHTDTYQNKVIADNPDFNTREIQAYSFAIIDTSDKAEMPHATPEWAEAEFKERVAEVDPPINPGNAYHLRIEVWQEFLDDCGNFDYTYNERMSYQISDVIEELKKHRLTRQAIIQVHDRKIDGKLMGVKRLPCSMFYQFMIRDGKLDVIYVMRSTDFVTHFQNDIYLAIKLQEYLATEVGIAPGKFIMFASSLHIYQKDWKELDRY